MRSCFKTWGAAMNLDFSFLISIRQLYTRCDLLPDVHQVNRGTLAHLGEFMHAFGFRRHRVVRGVIDVRRAQTLSQCTMWFRGETLPRGLRRDRDWRLLYHMQVRESASVDDVIKYAKGFRMLDRAITRDDSDEIAV